MSSFHIQTQIDFNEKLETEKKAEADKMYKDGINEENEYRRKVQVGQPCVLHTV